MIEKAFDGTVLEGRERRYTVINERDVARYVDDKLKDEFTDIFDAMCYQIERGRKAEGKKPYNCYLVINVDESYADEVVEIMKRNGHMVQTEGEV